MSGSEHQHELFPPKSCILLLNGFPGVGKFTIAKGLSSKLSLSSTPYRLVDNHLLIDPVEAIEPIRNSAHYDLRKSFRRTAFEGLKAVKEERLVVILTAALSTSELATPYNDIEQFGEYVDLASARGVPLVVMNVLCDLGTNTSRLCSEERREVKGNGKKKLVDIEVLQRIRKNTVILGREQALSQGGNILYFELDASGLKVEEATRNVWEILCGAEI